MNGKEPNKIPTPKLYLMNFTDNDSANVHVAMFMFIFSKSIEVPTISQVFGT